VRSVRQGSIRRGLQVLQGSKQPGDVIGRCGGALMDLDLAQRTEWYCIPLLDGLEVVMRKYW